MLLLADLDEHGLKPALGERKARLVLFEGVAELDGPAAPPPDLGFDPREVQKAAVVGVSQGLPKRAQRDGVGQVEEQFCDGGDREAFVEDPSPLAPSVDADPR
jgi:hypothetical protein